MLTIKDLSIARGGRRLFSSLSITLLPGSLTVVQGRNGCGKTSLLKVIAGILPPAGGEVFWEQPEAQQPAERNIYRQSLLFVGHENAIKSELTVVENLRYWAGLYDSELLIPTALHYFKLEPYAYTPCAKLSAGWKRRVALARLILIQAEIWLLDEPAGNLDEEGEALLNGLIATRCNQGGIVLVSSHKPLDISHARPLHLEDFAGT